MNEAHKLLERLLEMIASERTRIISNMKSGFVVSSEEEILNSISKITKLKRIESMLGDVKTLFKE